MSLMGTLYVLTPLWTLLTAVGTVTMAATTACVIRQNKKHHRDSFRPICVLVPADGADPVYARAEMLQSEKLPPGDYHHGMFEIRGSLKNVGVGPARNIILEVHTPPFRGPVASRHMSPLAKGESWGDNDHPLQIPVSFSEKFNCTDFHGAPGVAWEIWINYQDCFGTVFRTRHPKNPQEPWDND
jgi:hypothetical protein